MAPKKQSAFHSPFADLSHVLKQARRNRKGLQGKSAPKPPKAKSKQSSPQLCPEDENALFEKWMEGVKPLAKRDDFLPAGPNLAACTDDDRQDADSLVHSVLERIVAGGEGFVVSQTNEYVEGAGCGVHWLVPKRLHQGFFSIQAHRDLHGFSVVEAQDAFDSFMRRALSTRKRAVCVVHGRGLSSPDEPVLKTKVIEWLTKGPWRKWVLAFASAKACDGGAGATYVLLRNRPITHRDKKSDRKGSRAGWQKQA
ncbi:MAG: Smr/MutS family protein [Desulfatibacillaceae bacterium]|nr:Smr/MutS family protein [Desulfatibacillaceae bacterium]